MGLPPLAVRLTFLDLATETDHDGLTKAGSASIPHEIGQAVPPPEMMSATTTIARLIDSSIVSGRAFKLASYASSVSATLNPLCPQSTPKQKSLECGQQAGGHWSNGTVDVLLDRTRIWRSKLFASSTRCIGSGNSAKRPLSSPLSRWGPICDRQPLDADPTRVYLG
jgi:hypothetical protein